MGLCPSPDSTHSGLVYGFLYTQGSFATLGYGMQPRCGTNMLPKTRGLETQWKCVLYFNKNCRTNSPLSARNLSVKHGFHELFFPTS